MSLSIVGSQFVEDGDTNTYVVSGIAAGYTLFSVVLPFGWTVNSTGAIITGSQSFDFNVGIGSGTIIIKYVNGGVYDIIYVDVYSGACKMGEEIKQDGVVFIPAVVVPPPVFCDVNPDCTFPLKVFADPDLPLNKMNNDKSDFYFYGDSSILAITMVVQKYSNGSWSDIETIVDSTYGSFFPYGKHPDFSGNNFVDDFNKQYTGIFLEWIKIYSVYGIGRYKMKVTRTDIFGDDTTFYSKAEYCLQKWNCHATNGTIRIETINQGLRGTLDDNTIQIDYSTGWNSEIRLSGIFKSAGYSYTKEYNQYGDMEYNSFKPIINEQITKYKLQIKPVPGWMDWYLSTNVLQADQILITDFNPRNRHTFVQFPVINDGDVTILNEEYKNVLSPIELNLSYGQNSLRKRNS